MGSDTVSATELELVSLAHALVDDAAESCGIDYLVMKGLGAQSQGVSPIRTPGDVDVLVAPADLRALSDELERRGWRARTADADTVVFPRHSVSLFHEAWSCDIDVHFRFPGFDRPADEVFRAIRANGSWFDVAGRRIPVPSPEVALIIAVLHCLRSPLLERLAADYDALLVTARRFDGAEVVSRALELGAGGTAAPFLRRLWPGECRELPPPPEDWVLLTAPLSPNAKRIQAFASARGAARWRALRIALWPGTATLVKERAVVAPTSRRATLIAHVARWRRGVAALPGAIVELRRLGVRRDGR